MTSTHQIAIVGHSGAGHTTQILIDGKDISCSVSALHLDIDARHAHSLTVELCALPMGVHLEGVKVRVDDETAGVLQLLGWAPPPVDDSCPQ